MRPNKYALPLAGLLALGAGPATDVAKDAYTHFSNNQKGIEQRVEIPRKNGLENLVGGVANASETSDLINKGTMLVAQKNYSEGITFYDKAISLDQNLIEAFAGKSSAYSMWAESIQKTDPKRAKELYELSNQFAHIALNKLNENEHGLSQNQKNTFYIVLYDTLGFNHKLNGEKEKAIEYFKLELKYRNSDSIQSQLKELLSSL